MTVCEVRLFAFRCDRAKVSFMLITRIINDTRLILNRYRYFLNLDQSCDTQVYIFDAV